MAPATANRIVNGEQRPAPEIYPRGPKYRKLPARDWDPPASPAEMGGIYR